MGSFRKKERHRCQDSFAIDLRKEDDVRGGDIYVCDCGGEYVVDHDQRDGLILGRQTVKPQPPPAPPRKFVPRWAKWGEGMKP